MVALIPQMSTAMKGWKRFRTKVPVHIPTLDGKAVAETVDVEVEAWRNPKDGEIYLDGNALQALDDTKARYLGLMSPAAISELRKQLGVTQKRMAELLQIGEKSYCRWETGRERPSRSINLLLSALADGRIDVAYLALRVKPGFDWRRQVERNVRLEKRLVRFRFEEPEFKPWEETDEAVAA